MVQSRECFFRSLLYCQKQQPLPKYEFTITPFHLISPSQAVLISYARQGLSSAPSVALVTFCLLNGRMLII